MVLTFTSVPCVFVGCVVGMLIGAFCVVVVDYVVEWRGK